MIVSLLSGIVVISASPDVAHSLKLKLVPFRRWGVPILHVLNPPRGSVF